MAIGEHGEQNGKPGRGCGKYNCRKGNKCGNKTNTPLSTPNVTLDPAPSRDNQTPTLIQRYQSILATAEQARVFTNSPDSETRKHALSLCNLPFDCALKLSYDPQESVRIEFEHSSYVKDYQAAYGHKEMVEALSKRIETYRQNISSLNEDQRREFLQYQSVDFSKAQQRADEICLARLSNMRKKKQTI